MKGVSIASLEFIFLKIKIKYHMGVKTSFKYGIVCERIYELRKSSIVKCSITR